MALPDEKDVIKQAGTNPEDELEIHIEGDPEIEVVDDTPEADKGKKALPEGDAEPTEEEMEQYSEAVKKRIGKLKHGIHDERRAKEQAARERDEAVALAKKVLAEKNALASQYEQGEDAFIGQAKEKAEIAMAAAKREYREAYELGDAEKMADAQEKMATIAAEKREAEGWARQAAQRKENNARQTEKPVVQSEPSQDQQVPRPDKAAQEWAAKNEWFGSNKRMTNMAYAIHDELLEEGIDPARDSTEYYSKLNAQMREMFPQYEWGDTPKKKPASVVAPVTRTSKTAKRITLTQSQVAVAKRLGITPQQYAVELAKLEKTND